MEVGSERARDVKLTQARAKIKFERFQHFFIYKIGRSEFHSDVFKLED